MPRSGLDTPKAARTAPPAQSPARARGKALLAALALAIGLAPLASRADVPKGTITEIVIEGNESIARERILPKLESRVGREFDDKTIEHDMDTLTKTGWFSGEIKVWTKPDPERGGHKLIFGVQEMPILQKVEFRGMTKLKVKDVESNTRLKVGARADQSTTTQAVRSIKSMYREKGYDYAEVVLLEGGKHGDRKAIFEIFEGPKCQIRKVSFEGNKFTPDGVLDTKISNKPKLLGAWPVKYTREDLEEDAKKLNDYYQSLGFFEVEVTPVTRPGSDVGQIHVTYVIKEGVQFKVRAIRFEGNEKIPTAKLMEGMKLQKGQPFSDALKTVDEKTLRSKYGAIGCINAQILYKTAYTDEPGVVDLVYEIEEGAEYNLGRIEIKGNARTQSRVILREFNQAGIVPNEPLDANRIELAKKRLGNLRYFAMSPEMGKPLEIKISNPRRADQPYGSGVLPTLSQNEGVRARLQSAGPEDSRPVARLARRQDAPPAPGDGPASLAPISEPPPGFTAPPIDAPGPIVGPRADPAAPPAGGPPGPFSRGGPPGTPTPPVGNGEPPGTMPSIPGMNQTDVGPGRNEPFANRDYADIVTSLDETSTGRLMLGVGATSYGGIFGNLIVHESNFDYKAIPRSGRELFSGNAFRGAGQDLRIELSPGTQVNRAQISFRNPYVFDLPIGFGTSAYTFRRFYSSYTEDRTGGRFSLGRQFGVKTYADVAFRIEDVNFHGFSYPAPADYLAASGHTTLATLRPTLRFDNRNDPFATTAGQYLEFAFEQGWGNFTFPKFTVEGRQYFTLGSRPDGSGKRFVSLRGFYGISGRDTPVYERFYAGDFRSMRGFAYRGVGPYELGVNVGGIMTAVGSVEYQFPWTANDKLQQVVFCDFGTVEAGYNITQFRAAVGTGVRIYLPQQMFGPLPLAFDIAFPVVKSPEDHTRVFTFFIGAFW
ncbi:MAG: outer membrane protein/protective antigen [Planctomycetota bacterium]|nr:outer membrane protein/protective antigen [Planctomycetota bacterium]